MSEHDREQAAQDRAYELASSDVVLGFSKGQVETLGLIVAHALDQAHDAKGMGDDDYISEVYGCETADVEELARVLKIPTDADLEAAAELEPQLGDWRNPPADERETS